MLTSGFHLGILIRASFSKTYKEKDIAYMFSSFFSCCSFSLARAAISSSLYFPILFLLKYTESGFRFKKKAKSDQVWTDDNFFYSQFGISKIQNIYKKSIRIRVILISFIINPCSILGTFFTLNVYWVSKNVT